VQLDLGPRIAALRSTLGDVLAVVGVDGLRTRIAELEQAASAPDLWDDPEAAQKVTSELSHAQSQLARVTGVESRLDDLEVLIELVNAESDESQAEESVGEVESELTAIEATIGELEVQTLLNGEYDPLPAVVTIRAGAGGVDAADFAEMLMRMYLRWAEQHKFTATVMDTSYAEEAGIKSATFEIDAPYAFGTLSVEAGTHRLVRMSPFNSAGKRQTSFAAVEVIPLLEESGEIEVPESDIRVDVFRSSGPGGQSVNTTDSAVRITHLPTGIVVSMQNEKSQLQNREAGLRVLRARLLAAQQEAAEAEASAARRSQVRTVDRSERIRTYNYPENRISDHRTGYKAYNLDQVLDGALEPIVRSAIEADEAARLRALAE
jgi:peptide chain release factor 2